jgi:hypothetical protein
VSGRKRSVPALRASQPSPSRGEGKRPKLWGRSDTTSSPKQAADERPRTIARAPSAEARATGRTVTLREGEAESVASIMAALPDPASLPAGTLVVVLGTIASPRSLARSVLAALGRTKTATRARRCSALVARGYVGVAAADDDAREDLAWGYVPGTLPSVENA